MTAFRATYSDLKLIKTRKCVQIIFEVPQEDFDAAYEVLGGLPNPAADRWFGIAAINPGAALAKPETAASDLDSSSARPNRRLDSSDRGQKRDWRDLSPQQQAGIRCEEPTFAAFLKENHPDDWHEAGADAAECVRLLCQVSSRSELATNHRARVIWKQLDDEFAAWKEMEHA